jgi:hypothetical protein
MLELCGCGVLCPLDGVPRPPTYKPNSKYQNLNSTKSINLKSRMKNNNHAPRMTIGQRNRERERKRKVNVEMERKYH